MTTIYHIAPKRSGHAWVGHMIQTWFDRRELKYIELENVTPKSFQGMYPRGKGIVILQIRDFLNWYASYVTSGGRTNYEGKTRFGRLRNSRPITSWEAIAREYYRSPPKYIRNKEVVRVMYDDFFVDSEYRHRICEQLGGQYSEDNLLKVFDNGGGSSFDGQKYDGKATQMQTLERYKQVDPEIFRNIFRQKPGILKLYRNHLVDNEKREFIKSVT